MPKKPSAATAVATPRVSNASADAFASADAGIPIHLIEAPAGLDVFDATQRAWLQAQGFKPHLRRPFLVPDSKGGLAAVAVGAAPPSPNGKPADPMVRPELLCGLLPGQLPAGTYHLAAPIGDAELAAVAWGLGGYRYRRYKSGDADSLAQLVMPVSANAARVRAIVDGTAFGRDLINTPANDLGPAEIEEAARRLATAHGAAVTTVVGDDLLAANFPLIHAVGRASPRAPRLIDLRWQPAGQKGALRKVTLVGKGIAFDTGGLDLKPSAAMLIMKKDMGGAAAVLAAAHMIMSAGLPVHLLVVIAAAENSVSGNAFRPLDVIKSRAGMTVEIGNTDAEGRLVLADALAYADEDRPDVMMTFATLTGAARVALGAELPPFFTDSEDFAAGIAAAGLAVADPVWRLPFWTSYEAGLESSVADINNVSDGPFAGAITAALFLRKFVKNAREFAHFDIYGWRQAAKPLGPKGGEVNAARAVFQWLQTR